MTIDPRMTKARWNLIQKHHFWGQLVMYLTLVEDESVGTMATDGENLFYAPSFLDQLTQPKIEGVVAHETSHCTGKHHLRRGNRDPEEWNIACDYAINPMLIDAGFELPDGVLLDNQYRGMGAEEIYARRQQAKQQQQGQQPQQQGAGAGGSQPGAGPSSQPQPSSQPGQGRGAGTTPASQPQQPAVAPAGGATGASQPGARGPGSIGKVLDAPVPSSDTNAAATANAEQAAEWDRRVVQAVAVGRRAGTLPGGAEELVAQILEQKVDWRELLRRFIDAKTRTEHTWNRPNRRFISSGFILPGTQSDGINRMGIYVDSSGSINDVIAGKFFGQVEDAMELGAIDSVVVMQSDTIVQRVDEYRSGDTIKPPLKGRGGTSFTEGFKWFEGQDVAAIIVFTDLECGSDWGEDPGVPVLWAAYGYESQIKKRTELAPFGEVIHVEE